MRKTTAAEPAHTDGGALRLIAVRNSTLSVDEAYDAVRGPAAGGVVVFVGAVRDSDAGRGVERLGYSAHPTALARLREVAAGVADRFPGVALAAVHRIGDLQVGDLAVVVAASAAHRGEAFAAARALIDDLKNTVPIWKHQEFSDGSHEWVGTP